MNLFELKEVVDAAIKHAKLHHRAPENIEACIEVASKPNVVCVGTSVCRIRSAYSGFDWDSGKFIITPDTKLSMTE